MPESSVSTGEALVTRPWSAEMFPGSTQESHWMFEGVEAVALLRTRAHQAYLDRFHLLLHHTTPGTGRR